MNRVTAALNQRWAETVLDSLASSGVRTVVIAPGSRSTPLVMAAHRHSALSTVVHLDERSAGFFALGVGKATAGPAAVLTTSGTAVANLLPAVVEADASGTPLVALTADRPARLRGADANQTIRQPGIFGDRVRDAVDLPEVRDGDDARRHLAHLVGRSVALARGPAAGPVHINAPFAKPLEPATHSGNPGRSPQPPPITDPVLGLDRVDFKTLLAGLRSARKGIIVAGPAGPGMEAAAVELARATGFPVLADPLAGARYCGPAPSDVVVVGAYDALLRVGEIQARLRPDLVLQIGASPTSTTLTDFLASTPAAHRVVVDPGGRWKDHPAQGDAYYRCHAGWLAARLQNEDTRLSPIPEWSQTWRELDASASRCLKEALATEDACEGTVLTNALAGLERPSTVIVSNSMPIRDMDLFVTGHAMPLCVIGNRGASGIDGMVSTALGAAWSQSGERTSSRSNIAVLGDLAMLHDGNGLLAAREGMDLVILVINNDGGGIFHMLPIADFEPEFTRYFATPHGRNFRHLAAQYDIPYTRAESRDVEEQVRAGVRDGGVRIVEVRTDREQNHAARTRILDQVLERFS